MTRRDKGRSPRYDTTDIPDLHRGQARGVLATLVTAARWPARFPERLVAARELPNCIKDLSAEPNAIRQAVLRADQQLRRAGIEVDRTRGGPRGASSLSLRTPPSPRLENWLYEVGWRHLRREFWDEFLSSEASPPRTPHEAFRTMDEAVARALVIRGRKEEAVAHIDQALAQAANPRQRGQLTLARSMALIRCGRPADWERARDELLSLVSRPNRRRDIRDRVLEARASVELAYCHFLTRIMGNPDSSSVDSEIDRARAWLDSARSVESILLPGDRARLLNVDALLTKAEAALTADPLRSELFEDARRGFLSAFARYQEVGDIHGMGAVLYNLGELTYARHRLNEIPCDETAIDEALGWFKMSTHIADQLDTNRDFVVDYVRIADLLGTLIAVRSRAGLRAGLDELLSDAEGRLVRARRDGSEMELRLVDWVDRRLTERARIAGLCRRPGGRKQSRPASTRRSRDS